MQTPMSSPDIDEADIAAISAVLPTPYRSIGLQTQRGVVSPALPLSGIMMEEQVEYARGTLRRILAGKTSEQPVRVPVEVSRCGHRGVGGVQR